MKSFRERLMAGLSVMAVFCIPLILEHGPDAKWQSLVALIGMITGPGAQILLLFVAERRNKIITTRSTVNKEIIRRAF